MIDGDTVGILRDGREVRVRLEGIDCPEATQDFGGRAKRFTSDLAFGHTVTVDVRDVDRYGRLVARLKLGDVDVSLALVRAGLAWHFIRYSRDPVLADAERRARVNRTGLWIHPNAVPPWTYRRPTVPAAASQRVPASEQCADAVYHGNRQSKVLHSPACPQYDCENCKVLFMSITEAEAAGYRKHPGPGGCIN